MKLSYLWLALLITVGVIALTPRPAEEAER